AFPAQHAGFDLHGKAPPVPGVRRDRLRAPGLARRQRTRVRLVGRLVFESLQVGGRPPQPVPLAVVDLPAVAALDVAGHLDAAAADADNLVALLRPWQPGEAVAH